MKIYICPICGCLNYMNWPVKVKGEIREGGCQECWEIQADEEWWAMLETISENMENESRG